MKTEYNMTLAKTMRNVLTAVALLLLLGQTRLSAQTPQDAERLIDRGEYAKALNMIESLLGSDPKNEKLWYLKGRAYFELDEIGKAKTAFERGMGLGARYPMNYVGMGAVQCKEGNVAGAKENLTKAQEYNRSSDTKIMVAIADAWLNSNQREALDAAEVMLYKVLSLEKENKDAILGLGDLYDRQNITDLALENYTKAIGMDPKFIKGHLRIGQLQKKEKKFNEAASAFTKAIEVDPTFPPPHREMAEMWIMAGEYDKAVSSYEKYLELVNKDKSARIRYGSILYVSKKYDRAVQELESVMADTQTVVMYRILGYSYAELGNADKADANMKKYFEKADPKAQIPADFEYMGKISKLKGQNDVAVENYKKAIAKAKEAGAPRPELWTTIAEMYKADKKYDLEAQTWEAAMKDSKVTMKDMFACGRAWYNAQNYTRADSCFAEMTKIKADFSAGWLWRGRTSLKMNPDKALAKPYYEEVIKIIEANEESKTKFKADYLEALGFMGAFYTLQEDKAQIALGTPYWEKVLAIEPENKQATEGLAYCKKSAGQ